MLSILGFEIMVTWEWSVILVHVPVFNCIFLPTAHLDMSQIVLVNLFFPQSILFCVNFFRSKLHVVDNLLLYIISQILKIRQCHLTFFLKLSKTCCIVWIYMKIHLKQPLSFDISTFFWHFNRKWICRKSSTGGLCQAGDRISPRATWEGEKGEGPETDRWSGPDEGQAWWGGSREEKGCHSNTRGSKTSCFQKAMIWSVNDLCSEQPEVFEPETCS